GIAFGDAPSDVLVPLPVRSTTRSGAFDDTVTVADFAPVATGSKRTRTVHVAPAARTVPIPQSATSPDSNSKSDASVPRSVTAVSVAGAVPVFDTVVECDVVGPSSMSWPPNATGSGDASSAAGSSGASATPRKPVLVAAVAIVVTEPVRLPPA